MFTVWSSCRLTPDSYRMQCIARAKIVQYLFYTICMEVLMGFHEYHCYFTEMKSFNGYNNALSIKYFVFQKYHK